MNDGKKPLHQYKFNTHNLPKRKSMHDPDIEIEIDSHDKITEAREFVDEPKNEKSDDLRKNKHIDTDKKPNFFKRLSKKQKIILSVATVLILIAAAVVGSYLYVSNKNKPFKPVITEKKTAVPTVTPTTTASPLTGVQVPIADTKLPVTGVMIENTDFARPQSGLSSAGVVFEALTEGGITRFLALYQEGQPSSIGPIRSVRPYFVDWLLGFDAALAHVGGSPAGLAYMKSTGAKDLNQFYYSSYYTRISSRQAPHNVYTSASNLLALEKSLGYTTSNFIGFPRKADSPSKNPTATKIDFNPSYADFAVHYDYDSKNNAYLRSEGGSAMIDANTNQQIEPKVVIAIVVPWVQGILDSTGAYYSDYQDIGSGTAYIFQDGTVVQGTWQKSSPTSQIKFGDANGDPIGLNAGQTWITVVSSTSQVSFSH